MTVPDATKPIAGRSNSVRRQDPCMVDVKETLVKLDQTGENCVPFYLPILWLRPQFLQSVGKSSEDVDATEVLAREDTAYWPDSDGNTTQQLHAGLYFEVSSKDPSRGRTSPAFAWIRGTTGQPVELTRCEQSAMGAAVGNGLCSSWENWFHVIGSTLYVVMVHVPSTARSALLGWNVEGKRATNLPGYFTPTPLELRELLRQTETHDPAFRARWIKLTGEISHLSEDCESNVEAFHWLAEPERRTSFRRRRPHNRNDGRDDVREC